MANSEVKTIQPLDEQSVSMEEASKEDAATKEKEQAELIRQQDLRLSAETKSRVGLELSPHLMFAFNIPSERQEEFTRLSKAFQKITCSKTRAEIMIKIIQANSDNFLINSVATLPYLDQSRNFHYWQESQGNNANFGIKIKPDRNIDIITQNNFSGKEYAVFMIHKNLDAEGLAGGQILYIKENGAAELFSNTSYLRNDAIPKLSGNVSLIPEVDIQKHLQNARLSAQEFLAGRLFTAELFTPAAPLIKEETPVLAIGEATAKLEIQRAESQTSGLPTNIKVTGLEGAPVFEMHCPPFKEPGCFDENFNQYEATVYMLKKIGSNVDKDKSNALIIEVANNNGEVRLRSGTCGDKAIKAKISIQNNGQEYIAVLNEKEGGGTIQTFDQDAKDTPFRKAGQPEFMCIQGCCGHYTAENQRLMENLAMVKRLSVA